MKSAKIFIIFNFLLAFALQVSAQKIDFPNELKGYEFYKRGKLKDVELLTKTKQQIIEIFGDDCFFGGCSYNEDWDLGFVYYWEGFQKLKYENSVKKTYIVSPDYVDRLYAIILTPKKPLLLDRNSFSEKFKAYDSLGEHSIELKNFTDSNGLYYTLYYDDSREKGGLRNIQYIIPERVSEEGFLLIGIEEIPSIDY